MTTPPTPSNPREPDPFDALGLPPVFDLDGAAIQRAYLQRSAALHPDHAAAPADPETEARAAALNEAKATLEDPERRAAALLRRFGGPPKEADRSLPPAFLAEMMATREEIEEDRASGDPARMERWEDWAHERRAGHIKEVSRLFAAFTGGEPGEGEAVLRQIRQELNVWRYTERLLEQLDPDAGP